ncbi:MAG: hypothetical protein IJY67_04270 [Paludibacteraceae bacterium]|nr:hypothetical protein [Paludibacteraceae bacterium]
MKLIDTIGNCDLLNREKTLFLCSKRTPIGLYGDVFRWVDSLSEIDCIACFNSTEMEAEVLKALLVARIPTVLYVMNRFADKNNIQIEQAIYEKRLLIVVLKRDESRGMGATPRLRNSFVMSQCKRIVCGYVDKNGSVFPLLAGRDNVEFLVDHKCFIAAEPEIRRIRWTVAEDKVLLRMYYADQGIHAIHKKLQRSYAAIYQRVRSITLSEDVLKGREFEDYVLGLFDVEKDGSIILKEWQGDKSLGSVHPENNSNPDFVFSYKDQEFAVECKWRVSVRGAWKKELFTEKQIEKYKKFASERNIAVTMIVGIGGEPSNPEQLYIIPLDAIDSVISGDRKIDCFLNYSEFINVLDFCKK